MSDDRIAIVGASCRFPGAAGLDAFWRLLEAGESAVSEVDETRWATRYYHHPRPSEPGKSYTWAAGLLNGVDLFEPAFFGISPREAAQMDPQQRLLLELVWHAIEDAGLLAARLAGTGTGVYIGASSTDYSDLRLDDPAGADSYFMTGNTLSILANRLSYIFDLRGPSLTIDTACSSSLVALHHACEALRAGRIDTAIVGGINLLLAPYPFLGFCRASMLSHKGRCFAFDARADGYVRAEGGAAIVLKPLAAALADGDPVRAVILGTGVNSDGRTIGLSLPSEEAQLTLIRAVHARAGITGDDLAFFEMHGTGTPAGDPIEAAAVGHALGQARAAPLPIGSVKSNIGHLEPASGMAGLLKAVLALDRAALPASLNFETPNPNIPFEALNLRVVKALEPIADGQRCAGVNSFGFGGTNAHVVLAAAAPRPDAEEPPRPLPPLVISARSEAALRDLALAWREKLVAAPKGAAAALRAAARRRDQHDHRLVAAGRDPAESADLLGRYLDGKTPAAVTAGSAVREGRLVFAFSGNGAQFPGMAREAWQANAVFRDAAVEVDRMLQPQLGWSIAQSIANGVEPERMARTDVAQPLLFASQVGIVRALRALGIEAAGFVGHSVGEIAAAWAAGALSLEDAARIVLVRSREQQKTQGMGRMAALALGAEAARDFLAEMGSTAEVGAINAGHAVTISGPGAEIERLEFEARRRGLTFRRLDLDFAFHSPAMEPIRERLIDSLDGIRARAPDRLLVSTVSGEAVAADMLGPEYWWHNIRRPVRFSEAMARLVAAGHRIFLEIGPSAILQSYLNDALRTAEVPGRVLRSLSRQAEADDPFPAIAARCHVAGYDLTGTRQFDGPADPHHLPLYPWQRERFWFEKTAEARDLVTPPFDHPLLGFRQPRPAPCWLNHLDDQVLPWIADHAIEGVAVLPAAAMVEMALATAHRRQPEASVLEIVDLELRRPLPFDKERMREIETTLGAEDGEWQLASRPRLSSEPLTVHAVGRISRLAGAGPLFAIDNATGGARTITADALYRLASRMGLHYGPRFRSVEEIRLGGSARALVRLDPTAIGETPEPYLLHPALFDGALQGLLGLLAEGGHDQDGVSFLPWRFGRVRLAAPFGRLPRRAELRLTRAGLRSASADIALFDGSGELVGEFAECWFRRVELRRGSVEDRALRVDPIPAPLSETAPPEPLRKIAAVIERLAGDDAADARREQALLLDALIGALALQALRPLAGTEHPFTINELVDSGRLAAEAAGLAESLLRLLERLGAASREDMRRWWLDPATDLPEAREIWRLLLAEAPDLVGELALLATAAEELPMVLAGGLHPSEPGPPTMVEHLLQASPPSAAAIALVAAALGEIAAAWPEGRPLRILEIGTGGATRSVLQRLAQSRAALSYLATSADAEQAARLAYLADEFDGAEARQWSPSHKADEFHDTSFDIIFAANACARTLPDTETLARLRDRLAPGGVFLAVEPEPNGLWDLVFGRHAGWWQEAARSDERSPLRSGDEWRTELAVAGFVEAGAIARAAAPWPWAVFWGSAPSADDLTAAPAGGETASALTLVSGDGALAAALEARLVEGGHRVRLADAANTLADPELPEAVLFLAEPEEGADIPALAERIAAFTQVAGRAAERQTSLWLVTRDAQQASLADPEHAAAGAALWGLARVLANELPRLKLRLVDLAGTAAPEDAAAQIAAEFAADSPESEVVWTPHGRHVLRLRRGLQPRWAGVSDVLALSSGQAGGLDTIAWRVSPLRSPGPGEVEIEVAAAGLNFRDMMWAMGLLPEEALIDGFAGPTFGLECAGTVRALGPGVEGIELGDRVMGLAPASLSNRVVTAEAAVTPIPPGISFAEAATVPVTFLTVAYALGRLGQLAAGEYVLIHAAAGGVGLSAIQYAKHRGAVVIATAGSDVKRAFLRLAGADYVLNSRDLDFADAVRAITSGRGVDVVLNSLSGEAMEESLTVLKPFGRFLELGKRDFYLNSRIHLRPLRQNVSYFAIDVDQLPVHRPDLAASLLAEMSTALAEGTIRPLAHRVYRFADLDEAFRLMQGAGHIGKLVLVPAQNAGVRLREAPSFAARADGTYLVTGGLDRFGFEVARWLVGHGAGSIALLSRRGAATPGAAKRVAELTAAGAEVRVYEADVADRASLAAALAAIRAAGPALRGVVHAAAVIEDGFAADINATQIAVNLRAKLAGALALDALTADDPIELFLLFSSATTLLGAPGQSAYVAANVALEAVARQRRAGGKPALAVAWGPIEDAGYLAERPEMREVLARRLGAKPIPAAQALGALPALLASGLAVAGFAETRWSQARRLLPILAAPLFAELRTQAAAASTDEALADRLAALGSEEALALLRAVVAEEAATILRLPVAGIEPQRPLSEIGMDSLMAVELRLALESRLRVDLPLVSLAEGTSVASIAARLASAISSAPKEGELVAMAKRYEVDLGSFDAPESEQVSEEKFEAAE